MYFDKKIYEGIPVINFNTPEGFQICVGGGEFSEAPFNDCFLFFKTPNFQETNLFILLSLVPSSFVGIENIFPFNLTGG